MTAPHRLSKLCRPRKATPASERLAMPVTAMPRPQIMPSLAKPGPAFGSVEMAAPDAESLSMPAVARTGFGSTRVHRQLQIVAVGEEVQLVGDVSVVRAVPVEVVGRKKGEHPDPAGRQSPLRPGSSRPRPHRCPSRGRRRSR